MKLVFGKYIKYVELFFKILWKKLALLEKIAIIFLIFVLFLNAFGVFDFLYKENISNHQPLKGGVVVEGVVGQPKFINPLYTKNEADKILSSLVFSGLVGYNKQREIIPSLAERWEVSEDKKQYKIYLKNNIKWQDGDIFDANDVIYTWAVIDNPDYNEGIKNIWSGITLEKIDDYTVVFSLPKVYPLFLENLTVGILPSHLWADVPVKDFPLSSLNINAVGSGPYKIVKINKNKEGAISSVKMEANSSFSLGEPYIEDLEIKFYEDKDSLIKAYKAREFSSFGMYASESSEISEEKRGTTNYNISLPQYVSVFFNTKRSTILADKAVRQALAYATDKESINKAANYGAGLVINSPILPGYIGYNAEVKKYDLDIKAASSILSQAGWSDQNNDGIKEKDGSSIVFEMVVPNDPQFIRVVDEISKQWLKIGVKLNINKVETASLEKDYITPRNFDILVLGENIGADPDPYSYWHSSQSASPGLNLAQFENGEVDKLLEEARQSLDTNVRIKNYKKFQEILSEEIPAIFLYQPVYIYKIYDRIKGVDLSGINNTWDRFYNINEWYVKYK